MKNLRIIFATLFFISTGSNSFAAGYSTGIYSTSGLANSYAGSVTGIHDASDIFFNPSITAGIEKNQFVTSHSYLLIDIKTSNTTATASGSSVSGGNSRNAGENKFIPQLYQAVPLNKKTTLNFMVNSPFGLASKYDPNWAGRYMAIKSNITTVNLGSSIAHKISDQLSLGFGLTAQHYDAELTKAVAIAGRDYTGTLKGSDWGYGYNLGATYKYNDQLRFGIGYRSKIDYKLSGSSEVDFQNTYSDASAKTTTPESVTIGTSYELNDKLQLAYDATWTRWSRLRELQVIAYQKSTLGGPTNFNWRDSLMNSVGANYKVNDKFLVRAGLAYEKDAVTDANREPRVPSGNRIWTSFGFDTKINDSLSIDFAYVHQFFRNDNMSATDTVGTVNSNYKNKVDVISLGLKKNF